MPSGFMPVVFDLRPSIVDSGQELCNLSGLAGWMVAGVVAGVVAIPSC